MLLLTPNRVEALKACPQSTHLAYIRRRTTTGSDSSTPMRTGYFRLTHTHTAAYTYDVHTDQALDPQVDDRLKG